MINFYENLYYNYREKELSQEIKRAVLFRKALQAKAVEPTPFDTLMLFIGKHLVQLGSWIENRYDIKKHLECCA